MLLKGAVIKIVSTIKLIATDNLILDNEFVIDNPIFNRPFKASDLA